MVSPELAVAMAFRKVPVPLSAALVTVVTPPKIGTARIRASAKIDVLLFINTSRDSLGNRDTHSLWARKRSFPLCPDAIRHDNQRTLHPHLRDSRQNLAPVWYFFLQAPVVSRSRPCKMTMGGNHRSAA